MYEGFAVCCPGVTYGIRIDKIGIPAKSSNGRTWRWIRKRYNGVKMALVGQKIALEVMPVETYLLETPDVPWGRRVHEVAEILTMQVRTPGAVGRRETV